jgi:hypothetical protein
MVETRPDAAIPRCHDFARPKRPEGTWLIAAAFVPGPTGRDSPALGKPDTSGRLFLHCECTKASCSVRGRPSVCGRADAPGPTPTFDEAVSLACALCWGPRYDMCEMAGVSHVS